MLLPLLFLVGALLPVRAPANVPCAVTLAPEFLVDYLEPDLDRNLAARYPGSVLTGTLRHQLVVEHHETIFALPGPALHFADPNWGELYRLHAMATRDRRFRTVHFSWRGLGGLVAGLPNGELKPPFPTSLFLLLPPQERLRSLELARPALVAAYGESRFAELVRAWNSTTRPQLDPQTQAILTKIAATVPSGNTADILARIDEYITATAEPVR